MERADSKVYLCTNIGEQNTQTGRPDSACGVYFKESETSGCKIHPGSLVNKRFTCCGRQGGYGCQDGSHQTAHWPDEKAKLYFYPKLPDNPGLRNFGKKKETEVVNPVAVQICKAGLFKNVKPYTNPRTKHDLLMLKREKEKTEMKYCLNWACGMKFIDTEEENTNKSCLCHPGKYDHGSTGTKMNDYISEMRLKPNERKSVLWEPHWTCCRGRWEDKGCKLMKHRGLFVEEVESKGLRTFVWPDIRAKLYFGKVVSDKWKQSLDKYTYSIGQVKKIFSSRDWSLNNLPDLCDQLKLYLILITERPDYHLKFNDVVSQSGSMGYFEGSSIKLEKFLKWWFGDYADIIQEMTEIQIEKEKAKAKLLGN